MKHIESDHYLAALTRRRFPYQANYYAMYSSLLDGLVTDPALMQIPVDDHLVHRGDGVFESAKCTGGAIYNLVGHLERLERSASALNLPLRWSREQLIETSIETVRAGNMPESLIRIMIARGPGGFGVDPAESIGTQLYVIAYALPPPFMTLHPEGASVITSSIPVKSAFFAGVKSCNYLPNVLMKREAVEAGADMAVAFDDHGYLAEGSTENCGIVTDDQRLLFPKLDNVLCGTTMIRVMHLAGQLVAEGVLTAVAFADITKDDIRQAREILIVGTTRDVTFVREFDGVPIGAGKERPVYTRLSALLNYDIFHNKELRTVVFDEACYG